MNIYLRTGPRVLHSPLTNFTVLYFVLCVRYSSCLTVSSLDPSCRVWCGLCTLYYHVKPQPHDVKLQSRWVKHYSYHDKFSRHLRSFRTNVNLHTYLCCVKQYSTYPVPVHITWLFFLCTPPLFLLCTTFYFLCTTALVTAHVDRVAITGKVCHFGHPLKPFWIYDLHGVIDAKAENHIVRVSDSLLWDLSSTM
jgi:hypothetical protein